MNIGVISDTHNYFDSRITALFRGVDHILHAGDVGQPTILDQLREIAPVTAVTGNTDDPVLQYRLTEIIELAGVNFLLHHIVNPHSLRPDLQEKIARTSARVVVFGHTHKPFDAEIGNVRFFNPGYAGKTRFGLKRSVGILRIKDGQIAAEFLGL